MIHLHWHSHYSLLEAVWSPWKIVDKAKELWMESIAITDYHWMYWAIEFYQDAQKAWIKPIIWTELEMIWENQEDNKTYKTVLIAKNYTWYENLLKLVSYAHVSWYTNKPTINQEVVKKYSSWLVAIQGWENSQIWSMAVNNFPKEQIKETIKKWQQIFGEENFFLEIIAQNEKEFKNTKKSNQTLLEISNDISCKAIISNNYSYINKEDKQAYEALICIKEWKAFDWNKIKWDYHIMSKEEIQKTMKENWYDKEEIENLISNNINLSKECNLELQLWKILFPKYEANEKIQDLYQKEKDNLVEK